MKESPEKKQFYPVRVPADPEKKQIRFAAISRMGVDKQRPDKVNQDSCAVDTNINAMPPVCYFGVNDGHGQNGHLVSEFLKEHLPGNSDDVAPLSLLATLKQYLKAGKTAKTSLLSSFELVNKKLHESSIDIKLSGSTSVDILINTLDKSIVCANVGDSRAILASYAKEGNQWKSMPLSHDHKPSVSSEAQRILKNGGCVRSYKDADGHDVGPLRVWLSDTEMPGLGMSRSFGDKVASTVGVTWVPEILEKKIEPEDKFIVLGSDGIWEFINNKEVVSVHRFLMM
jgi:serine/threonine protein phosphatase PrpC